MERKEISQCNLDKTSEEDCRLRESAMEAAGVGAWEVQLETNTISWDKRCRELFGVFTGNAISCDQIMTHIHPNDIAAVKAAVENALGGRHDGKYSIRYRTIGAEDGKLRWVQLSGQAYFNEDGQATRFIGIAQDITASSSSTAQRIDKLLMKENAISINLNDMAQDAILLSSLQSTLEQEIQKHTAELDISNEELKASNDELNAKNEELAELNRELKQSNEDLQQFAHVASHDLKEPLRKIKTYISRLEEDINTPLSAESTTYISKMYLAADRMYSMIDGVLAYSMINGSKQEIQNIDLNRIINDIVNDLEILITQKRAVIHYKELPNIEGASVLIYQLFYNLISNSLKFCHADIYPVIIIKSTLIHDNDQQYVHIELSDNGIGFNHEEAAFIFNTFARLNPKDKYEGTGLGLSLCKKIVQRHKGKIYAKGVTSQGATFIIILPLRQMQEYV
ncbi:ATP-binding protein [Chitinophaga ginsengisoli]|nr:ATP-binding protein [Chitinophaga ginsengisoli]